MELKNSDVLALSNILPPVAAAVPNKTAFKLKHRLNRNIDFVTQEIARTRKAESELVDSFTQKDEEGNPEHPKGEDGNPDLGKVVLTDAAGFKKAYAELMESTVTVPLQQIPLAWFDGIDAPTDDLFRHCPYLIDED